mgnify:CR=1 FL=1
MGKFCPCSYLRAEIRELKNPTGMDWKDSVIDFHACWKKCDVPIYTIPVRRAFEENFWDLCQEAWHAPIPENFDKHTDSDCRMKVCDWTGLDIFGVEINFAYECNAKCVFCTYTHKYNKEAEDLYYKCLNDIKDQDILISLTTVGEPFFNKQKTLDYLRTLYNKEVNIVTNGTLLTVEDAEELIRIKKERLVHLKLSISVNGASQESLTRIENYNVDLDRLKTVIKILHEADCIGTVSTVVVPANLSDLPKLKDFFDGISSGLSEKLHVMTNLNCTVDDAQIVINSKEWKDYFGDKENTMFTVPKTLASGAN